MSPYATAVWMGYVGHVDLGVLTLSVHSLLCDSLWETIIHQVSKSCDSPFVSYGGFHA